MLFLVAIIIYEILEKSEFKTTDGHALYYAKCTVCGKIVKNRLSEFKRRKYDVCRHRYRNTEIEIKPMTNKKAATIFNHIIRRCYNKESKSYRFYGAKGIGVCDEWLNDPEKFSQWYEENTHGKEPEDISVDRIDES
ncbi:MAG: hypothetical protein GX811_02035 [Lentisphaerae bacterium]|nr:hypothetical protein [Lentisphaerota bacterium]